jgi:hypothetical protein
MPTISLFPLASSDDGGDWNLSNFAVGEITRSMGDDSGAGFRSFIRFPNVTIPQGATIDACNLILNALFADASITVNVNLMFQNADDPIAPTSTPELTAAIAAATSVINWNNISPWSADETGADTTSPELKTILQTVINRAGWVSGNSLLLIIDNNVSSTNALRRPKLFDWTTGLPELSITYTEAPAEVKPFNQLNWPTFKKKSYLFSWLDNYTFDQTLPEVVKSTVLPPPRKRQQVNTWIESALESTPTLVSTIGKSEYQIPTHRRARQIPTISGFNPSASLVAIPFTQTEWPNPRDEKYPLTHIQEKPSYYEEEDLPDIRVESVNPSLRKANQVGYIFSQQIEESTPTRNFEWKNPVEFRQPTNTWIDNLLQTTLEPAPGDTPFNQTQWDNPLIGRAGKGWIDARTIYMFEFENPVPILNPVEVRIRKKSDFVPTWIQNAISIADTENPPINSWLALPSARKREAITWLQNHLEGVISPATPPNQTNWPLPIRIKQQNNGFVFNSIQGEGEGNQPFSFIEFRTPVKRVIAQTWTDNPLIDLTAIVGPKPFNQNDWPIPREKPWYDVYTLLGQDFIILPDIHPRRICLLADAAEFNLEATLEVYDLDARLDIFDLEAGGTECE